MLAGAMLDKARPMFMNEFLPTLVTGFADGTLEEAKFHKLMPMAVKVGEKFKYSEEEVNHKIAEKLMDFLADRAKNKN
jgi:hypothetical protein